VTDTPSTRSRILTTANQLTHEDRDLTYGDPYSTMLAFASLLQGYFEARGFGTVDLDAEDAAHIMELAKMARTCDHSLRYHEDNYIDRAAYAAIAGQCAEIDRECEA
jgi:hypothetical protein